MDTSDIILIVFGYLVLATFTHFMIIGINGMFDRDFPLFYTPATFYQFSEMNWFGCIMLYVLLLPWAFVWEIGGFIKWLFTTGRKTQ